MATGWKSKAINIYYFRVASWSRSYVKKELNNLSNGQVTDLVVLCACMFVATEGRAIHSDKKLNNQMI